MAKCSVCKGNGAYVVLIEPVLFDFRDAHMMSGIGFQSVQCHHCLGTGSTDDADPLAYDFPLFDMPTPEGMRTPLPDQGLLAVAGEIIPAR